jgi:hypothetical protein
MTARRGRRHQLCARASSAAWLKVGFLQPCSTTCGTEMPLIFASQLYGNIVLFWFGNGPALQAPSLSQQRVWVGREAAAFLAVRDTAEISLQSATFLWSEAV